MQTACLELLVLLIGCGLCSVQNHYKAFKKFLKPVQILLLFVQDLLSSLRTETKGKINWIKTFKPRKKLEPQIEHIVHVSGIDNKAWNVQSKETTHQKIIWVLTSYLAHLLSATPVEL